jgi:hypothetical protein
MDGSQTARNSPNASVSIPPPRMATRPAVGARGDPAEHRAAGAVAIVLAGLLGAAWWVRSGRHLGAGRTTVSP